MASASLAWLSWTSRSRSRISRQNSGDDDVDGRRDHPTTAQHRTTALHCHARALPPGDPCTTPRRFEVRESCASTATERACWTRASAETQRSQPTTARKVRIRIVATICPPIPKHGSRRQRPACDCCGRRQARAALRRSSRDSSPVASPPHCAQCWTWRHDLSNASLRVEQDDEGLRHRVDVEPEVGRANRWTQGGYPGPGPSGRAESASVRYRRARCCDRTPGRAVPFVDHRRKRDDQPSTVLRLCDDRRAVTARRHPSSARSASKISPSRSRTRTPARLRVRAGPEAPTGTSVIVACGRDGTRPWPSRAGELAELVLRAAPGCRSDDETMRPGGCHRLDDDTGTSGRVRILSLAASPEMSCPRHHGADVATGFRTVSPDPSRTTVSPGTATLPPLFAVRG